MWRQLSFFAATRPATGFCEAPQCLPVPSLRLDGQTFREPSHVAAELRRLWAGFTALDEHCSECVLLEVFRAQKAKKFRLTLHVVSTQTSCWTNYLCTSIRETSGCRSREFLVLFVTYELFVICYTTQALPLTTATVIVLENIPNAQSSIRPRCLDAF